MLEFHPLELTSVEAFNLTLYSLKFRLMVEISLFILNIKHISETRPLNQKNTCDAESLDRGCPGLFL